MNMQIGRGQAYLEVGTYKIMVAPFTSTAGMYTLEVEYTAPDTGDTNAPEGSETNPCVWTELPANVTFESDAESKIYYTFTATEAGTIVFTWSEEGDSWGAIEKMVDGQVNDPDSVSTAMNTTMERTLEAGVTYRISLSTWNTIGEVTIGITFTPAA